MNRVTKADLDQLVTIIESRTGDDGYSIVYAYGRPRLYHETGTRVVEVSPRLSAREMSLWLDGFIEGIDAVDVEEEEEEHDNPSYRGYYIYPDLTQRHWHVVKGGFHITTQSSEDAAQRAVDGILEDGDDFE